MRYQTNLSETLEYIMRMPAYHMSTCLGDHYSGWPKKISHLWIFVKLYWKPFSQWG